MRKIIRRGRRSLGGVVGGTRSLGFVVGLDICIIRCGLYTGRI